MSPDPEQGAAEVGDTELVFRIGDVFPSSDPVARYVTGVAMISNDWGRLFQLQDELGERHPGPRLLLYRFQLALHFEAVKFIQRSQHEYPDEIGRFLASLPAEAQEIHGTLVDEGHLGRARVEDTRNTSFHYPRILRARFDRGEEEMARLLEAAKDLEGEVEASAEPRFLKYSYADEVALQMLPMTDDAELDQEAIAAFRDRAMAVRRFAELVVNSYVDGQPNDDLGVVSDDEAESRDEADSVG